MSEFGEIIYVLTELYVARYNHLTDEYWTPVSLAIGQTLMIEPQADTDELRAYGAIVDKLTITTKANITLSAGSIERDAFFAMAAIAAYTSGLTPNQVVTSDLYAGEDLPYFGVIGVAFGQNGAKVPMGCQKCKLDNQPSFNLDGKTNKFNLQEIKGTGMFVERSSKRMMTRVQYHETPSTTWTPPASGADFKAFFTSPAPVT